MSLSIWTQNSGYNLGTFSEAANVNIPLPLSTVPAGVTFNVISGALPGGVYINGSSLIGNPYVVANQTSYSFCIRATNGTDISDRTFTLLVSGSNPPTFVTPAGTLTIGQHEQLYTLDQTYISYQIEAFDLNTAAGLNLNYSIISGDGELPPGLSLSTSGLISGFIKPALKITPADGSGTYDESIFDAVAYDFGVSSSTNASTGYDDFQFDDEFYDVAIPDATLTTLSRNYQFKVTLTDGINYAQRVFRIFVIGDDSFRADTTTLDGFAGKLYTADSTYIRKPAWMTGSNLGTFKANNYLTALVALYEKSDVLFRLETTNQELYATSKQLTNSDNVLNSSSLTINNASGIPQVAQYLTFDNYLENATGQVYQISHVASLGNNSYRLTVIPNLELVIPDDTAFYIGSLSKLPTGTQFDVNTAEIYGVVPYQPAVTTTYTFTIVATRIGLNNDSISAGKTFTINIVGDITSQIVWNTNSKLGSINADYISTLHVSASSNIPNAIVVYEFISGRLPPGLTLNPDGEIIGTPNQYYSSAKGVGIISFDSQMTIFDANTTTFDRSYTFTVLARDQYGYSAASKSFTIDLHTPNLVSYSNIKVQPLLASTQRSLWNTFINDTLVFTPNRIYRPNDSNFGLQTKLSMLVYAGIQTEDAAAYIGAMGLNHKRKRFQFGSLGTAIATDPVTGVEVYEVVYVNMIDPREFNGKHLPHKIMGRGLESDNISTDSSIAQLTVDSTGLEASNPHVNTYFPNSISNWQANLSQVGATERNYLPLWMRTIQPGSKQQLGYITAIPICYCQVGTAATILLNIQHSGFDFKAIDYTVDRYIIDSVTGYASDKYLIFRNDRITV